MLKTTPAIFMKANFLGLCSCLSFAKGMVVKASSAIIKILIWIMEENPVSLLLHQTDAEKSKEELKK
jgi:hypothetical protein